MAQKRHTPGSDDDLTRWEECPDCASPDPQVRSRHQMDLARGGDLDTVRAHLTKQYVDMRNPDKARPDVVDDVCSWLATLKSQYSGMADERTGAPITWWEMRRRQASDQRTILDKQRQKTPPHGESNPPAESVADLLRRHVQRRQAEEPDRGDEETPFQALMFTLIDRSMGRWVDMHGVWHDKLTLEGRSTQCYEWANQYSVSNPQLAEELQYQGRAYARELIKQQEKEARDA